jgi:alkanesulfonate monooxygenase
MTVEFISSFISARPGCGEDPDFPVQAAACNAEAGFDKLLIGYDSGGPDGLVVANEVLTTTSRLGVVVAHAPGLVAPTVAARQYATLAAFHRGRVAMHVLTESAAADGLPDGDGCDPAARYRRAAEFVEVVKRSWDAPGPFDFSGEFYRIAGACAPVCAAGRSMPVYCSGESDAAAALGAAHADVYVLAAAPASVIARRTAQVLALAAELGRSPKIAVSIRLAAAPAGRVAVDVRGGQVSGNGHGSWIPPANLGTAPGGRVKMTGEYDQIGEVLLEYAEAGVAAFVIGHDPLADAAACAEVIAQVRSGEAGR